MSQGRGSAYGATIVALAVMNLLAQAKAATYVVGGSGGWTFNVESWPSGMSFRAGDTLIFKYDPSNHNVVVVDSSGYSGCQPSAGAKFHTSGNDQLNLVKGENYFICSFAGHCESGMKIAVNAA